MVSPLHVLPVNKVCVLIISHLGHEEYLLGFSERKPDSSKSKAYAGFITGIGNLTKPMTFISIYTMFLSYKSVVYVHGIHIHRFNLRKRVRHRTPVRICISSDPGTRSVEPCWPTCRLHSVGGPRNDSRACRRGKEESESWIPGHQVLRTDLE